MGSSFSSSHTRASSAVKISRGETVRSQTPKWMGELDRFGVGKSFLAGWVLSVGIFPKNLVLVVQAALIIAQTGLPFAQEMIVFAVFAILGTAGVAIPAVAYAAAGERAKPSLDRWKTWVVAHNDAIMFVVFLVYGSLFVGKGIGGLLG